VPQIARCFPIITRESMSNQLINVHDAFFKQVLSDPKLADTFLREHLPADVVALLGPEPPEPLPGTFVDEELRQHHSDLLFRVRLKAGSEAFAYMLLEHKSSPDPGARLQLLRYVLRILTHWYDQNQPKLPLPPVLPLLANQGPGEWRYSCEFADLFGAVPPAMTPYLPSFRHALVDLPRVGDLALSTEVRLRAFLKALKYIRRVDLSDRIDILLAEAPVLDEKDLRVILTYVDKGPTESSNKVLREGWLTQPYYDQGKAEGEAQGEAKILTRLLERRFGTLPDPLRQRIFTADVGSIEAWAERTFDAPDLQSIFDSN
jgi:hypothetical protein